MSSEGAVEALEITDSGFTITKQISRPDGEHLQIDLEITSTHEEQSTVEIMEPIPEGTDQSQIGFLPNSEPREWNVTDDGSLRLQARLVAKGTRQIVYGVRDVDEDGVEVLGGESAVVAVGGPAGVNIDVDADDDADEETADDDADEETADDDADDETTEVEETTFSASPGDSSDDQAVEATTDGAGGAVAEIPDDAVVLEFPLDDETAEQLADELEPHLDSGGDMDAVTETKLSQLQEDVADMRAYLPAFEEFLGDTGRAEDIQEELTELREEVENVDEVPDDLIANIESMEDQIESLDETAGELDDTLEELDGRLDDVEDWRESIAAASQPDE